MENQNNPEKQNFKRMLAYVPFVNIVIFFVEENKDTILKKHLKYWIVLFVLYIILAFLLSWMFQWILFLWYIIYTIYLWYRVYDWEDFDIKFIDNILSKLEK